MTAAQRLLFDALTTAPLPRSRRTDPETSRAAATRAKLCQHAHHAAILAVLRDAPQPLNAYQIAERTVVTERVTSVSEHTLTMGLVRVQLTQVQVCRRLAELLRVGLVVVDGETDRGRCFRLGGNAQESGTGGAS